MLNIICGALVSFCVTILLLFIIYYPKKDWELHYITIKDSYSTWAPSEMKKLIDEQAEKQGSPAPQLLNRGYPSMYIEWYVHNFGYYLTKPFCFIDGVAAINERSKHVDLEERGELK